MAALSKLTDRLKKAKQRLHEAHLDSLLGDDVDAETLWCGFVEEVDEEWKVILAGVLTDPTVARVTDPRMQAYLIKKINTQLVPFQVSEHHTTDTTNLPTGPVLYLFSYIESWLRLRKKFSIPDLMKDGNPWPDESRLAKCGSGKERGVRRVADTAQRSNPYSGDCPYPRMIHILISGIPTDGMVGKMEKDIHAILKNQCAVEAYCGTKQLRELYHFDLNLNVLTNAFKKVYLKYKKVEWKRWFDLYYARIVKMMKLGHVTYADFDNDEALVAQALTGPPGRRANSVLIRVDSDRQQDDGGDSDGFVCLGVKKEPSSEDIPFTSLGIDSSSQDTVSSPTPDSTRQPGEMLKPRDKSTGDP